MCEALDRYSKLPFYHVIAVDNCGDPPIKQSEHRAIITFRDDYHADEHKNKQGQGLQLAYTFGTGKETPYGPRAPIDHIFLIESDVIVQEGWDERQIELSTVLPDWATLDVTSIDAEGSVTYPATISPRHSTVDFHGHSFDHQHYADFQCTLFNPLIWTLTPPIRFDDFPSHFDILFSRKVEERTGLKHYRSNELKAIHYPSSSRNFNDPNHELYMKEPV